MALITTDSPQDSSESSDMLSIARTFSSEQNSTALSSFTVPNAPESPIVKQMDQGDSLQSLAIATPAKECTGMALVKVNIITTCHLMSLN